MNRIVLIGNGFDLAHNLPTKYEDFINWYWGERIKSLENETSNISKDVLCTLKLKGESEAYDDTNKNSVYGPFYANQEDMSKYCPYIFWQDFYIKNFAKNPNEKVNFFFDIINQRPNIYEAKYSPLFENICKSIEIKRWVDIENVYYDFLRSFLSDPKYNNPKALNDELDFIKSKLINYLTGIQNKKITEDMLNENIQNKILEPIKDKDLSVGAKQSFEDFDNNRNSFTKDEWISILQDYYGPDYIKKIRAVRVEKKYKLLPDNIMLLNFNYTKTADMYFLNNDRFKVNHIHGNLENPDSIIFGYGDELDINYKELSKLNENEYLRNIKSIKYLESSNYRDVLSFIESAPYQIYIMGHSCGNSDRTLLNTLFEHKNCVSIKPFYYKSPDGKDNYLDIVQNISRNFTDMKLMRDRVVNKEFCEPLPQNR